MEYQWFYCRNGESFGPIDGAQLLALARDGEIVDSDLLWHEGMQDWTRAGDVGLGIGATGSQPPAPEPPPLPQPNNSANSASPSLPVGRATTTVYDSVAHDTSRSTSASSSRPAKIRWDSAGPRRGLSASASLLVGFLLGAVTTLLVVGLIWATNRGHSKPDSSRSVADAKKSGTPERNPGETVGVADEAGQGEAAGPPAAGQPVVVPEPERNRAAVPPTTGAAAEAASITKAEPSDTEPDTEPDVKAAEPPLAKPAEQPLAGALEAPARSIPAPVSVGVPPPETTSSPAPTLPVENRMRYRMDDHRVFQLVDIRRQPKFILPTANVSQDIRYQVLSRLHLGAVAADGTREVTQYVEDTRLLAADAMSRATFAGSLRKLKGQQFLFTMDEFHEVTKFRGHEGNRQVKEVAAPGGNRGMMVTSVIDEDGWKELAQFSFLQVERDGGPLQTWSRPMTHDWGEFGKWVGNTRFDRNKESISFQHYLRYQPADFTKAPPIAMGMKLRSAAFRPTETKGQVLFNWAEHRVEQITEVFTVSGTVEMELLGQVVPVQLTESQHIEVKLSKENPWIE